MGKDEEKKRNNIHNRRRETSTASLPLDLTSEILLRLPAKSIARFRCVSKLWSSITTKPSFINSFGTRFSPHPNLLLFFKRSLKMFVFSFPQHNSDSESSKPVYSYEITHPKDCSFSPTESVHGLICFRKKTQPIIWNPPTKQFLALREPEKSWKTSIKLFLGYDPIEGKHKVVCIPSNKASDECRVLTLGTTTRRASWRSIQHNQKHRPFADSCGRCINGVLYYKVIHYGSNDSVIMSFDVRTEKLDVIELPPENNSWSRLRPYQGRLGCLVINTLFVLEDANATKHIWESKNSIEPFVGDHDDDQRFGFCGITHAGEFIYAPYSLGTSFCVMYFDPKRDSFRKVKFKGIPEYAFRDNQGLLHTFPNHIESPISL